MKKTLSLILTALLVSAVFYSCGSDKDEENAQINDEALTEAESKDTEDTEKAFDKEEIAENGEDPVADGKEQNAPDVTDEGTEGRELVRGNLDGTRYENSYFGIGFDVGEEWYFADDEMKAAVIDEERNDLNMEDITGIIEEYGSYPEIVASNTAGGTLSIIIVPTPKIPSQNGKDAVADAKLAESLRLYKERVGEIPVEGSLKDITVAGRTYNGYVTSFTANETMHIQEGAVIHGDEYVAVISISGFGDRATEAWSNFFALK